MTKNQTFVCFACRSTARVDYYAAPTCSCGAKRHGLVRGEKAPKRGDDRRWRELEASVRARRLADAVARYEWFPWQAGPQDQWRNRHRRLLRGLCD